jgi:hypothetical protein
MLPKMRIYVVDLSMQTLITNVSIAESNMNDLVSEYQQYQEATADDEMDEDEEYLGEEMPLEE